MKVNWLKNSAKVLLWTVVFTIMLGVTAEWYLTRLGYGVENPADYTKYDMYDRYLGWTNAAGSGTDIPAEHVWPDSSRVSRPQRAKKAAKRVLLLGCSHTFGLKVGDADTFAWKLNERFPNITFDNFGVNGYSTYQCYLRAKQILSQDTHYDLVLYCGFLDHLNRNCEWKSTIGNIRGKGSYTMDPRVDLDSQGNMVFDDPVRCWWGEDKYVTVCFAKRVYYCLLMNLSQAQRKLYGSTKHILFCELNRRLADLVSQHGAKYGVVWLFDKNTWYYVLSQRQYWHDNYPWPQNPCRWEATPEYPCLCIDFKQETLDQHRVPGETNHYDSYIHSIWAKLIGDWVERLLVQPNGAKGEL